MRITITTGAALAISLLALSISADSTTTDTGLPTLSGTSTSDSASATTTDSSASSSNTDSSSSGTDSSSSGTNTASSTDSSSSSGSDSSSLPAITSATTDAGLTGFPTLSGAYSYPSASVPPTSNAPYMRSSSYPEGTVFIAVGAILGALAFAILAWRGLVAWSLHRSVSRAANSSTMADAKSHFRTPAAPFYRYADGDSTMSLANLGGKSKGGKHKTTASASAAQNLFFSPTAVSGKGGQMGNRTSNYLPAGYYAAGAGNPRDSVHHATSGISLSNLGPPLQGYSRARSVGATPPDSPNLRARDDNRAAPSAYLENMMDEGAERGRR